jgi:hypothetical protein
MNDKNLQAGDIVVFSNHLYNGVNHMTPGKEYKLQEAPVQDVWPLSDGTPYYPQMKAAVLNDKGDLIRLNACRFRLPESANTAAA